MEGTTKGGRKMKGGYKEGDQHTGWYLENLYRTQNKYM